MKARVWAGEALLRTLGASWRIEWDGLDRLEAARRASPSGNVIYAFWHSGLAILAYTHRRRDIHVLVSQHRDGEWIARILGRFGYHLVRGSSRRGGTEALFRMATLLKEGHDVAVTVDGPIGPRFTVHSGVVLMARRTGRPIVPVIPTFASGARLDTWDELRLPFAGTRIRIRYGEGRFVAPRAPQAEVANERQALQDVLRDLTRSEETGHGRSIDFEDVQDRRSYFERVSERSPAAAPWVWVSRAYAAGLAFDRALRPPRRGRGQRPWVIGIGNLEAGGTGKTPVLLTLTPILARCGISCAVLTRGHGGVLGRTPEWLTDQQLAFASDETRLLRFALPASVEIVVSREKRAGLELLRAQRSPDVVLVDDAFQTRGLEVDRHLVLLDWTAPLANGALLPAGRLREPPEALGRADALLFTRASGDTIPSHDVWQSLRQVGRCFLAFESAGVLRTPAGVRVPEETMRGRNVAVLSGLGRPQAFEAAVRARGNELGFRVRRCVRVGDHAPIEPELRKLAGRLAALGCEHVVVTAKDAARLPPGSEWNEPLLVLEQRLVIRRLAVLLETLLPPQSSAKLAKLTDSEAST